MQHKLHHAGHKAFVKYINKSLITPVLFYSSWPNNFHALS